MNKDQARAHLLEREYNRGIIERALARAAAKGSWKLPRHQVSVDPDGDWTVIPVPWPEGAPWTPQPPGIDLPETEEARLDRERRALYPDEVAAEPDPLAWQQSRDLFSTGLEPVFPPGARNRWDLRHVHEDDGTAEGCPGCFPGPAPLLRADVLTIIETVDAHLDANTAPVYRDQPLAGHWSRIGKAQSEANEAVEALAGVTGENPRKGVCDTWEHVTEELGDTACAALFGIQHVTKDVGATWAVFLAALDKAYRRVPEDQRSQPRDQLMSCPCGRGDYELCTHCPYSWCSVHGEQAPGHGTFTHFPPESGMDDQAAAGNGITGSPS